MSCCALLLACGNGIGATDDSTGTGTSITSATATSPQQPTTGDAASAEDSSAGSGGASHSDTSDGPATSATTTTGSSTTTASTGPDLTTAGPAASSNDDDGDSTSVPSGDPVPCQIEMTQLYPVPPSVLFLLDKSGSMGDLPEYLWDHDDNEQTPKVTRWSSLHAVVEDMVTKFNDTVDFGVKLYPKKDATPYKGSGACDVDPGVEVEIAPKNKLNVLAGIPAGDFDVLGGTPMEGGIKEAFNYLDALDPDDQRFILMIADGDISKTCEDQNFYEALAVIDGAWQDHGIATYVVGIAIDDPSSQSQLADLADAGGKANVNGPDPFYSTQNQIELEQAIQGIVDDTLSCTIDVTPEPDQPDLFQVWIGADEIPATADCNGDGWMWTMPHKQIELCGDACLQLKKTGKVETRYFCTAG